MTTDTDPPAQAQSAAPAATEESLVGNVQLLQDNAMAQEMLKLPEPIKQQKLTQPEMAIRFRGKAQVVKGSSLFIGDSSFSCKRTHDQYGELLVGKTQRTGKSRKLEISKKFEISSNKLEISNYLMKFQTFWISSNSLMKSQTFC